ncbi:MAG: outer membrane beta-barrel protein [Bacteroidota bacterium]
MIKPRYLLILMLLFCADRLWAQSAPKWGGGADEKDYSFGFNFSYVSSYFKIDKNTNWRNPFFDNDGTRVTDSLNSINSPNSQGFAVGFLYRHRITEHLEARITPGLLFADRQITYTYTNPSQNVTKSVQATQFDLPLSLKLKSDRIHDVRLYVLGGVKYSKAIAGKANADVDKAPIDKLVKNVGGFASYEAAFGCDIYFEFFKLSPEVRLSNSFGDVMRHENNAYSSPISKLGLHTLTFSLIFE